MGRGWHLSLAAGETGEDVAAHHGLVTIPQGKRGDRAPGRDLADHHRRQGSEVPGHGTDPGSGLRMSPISPDLGHLSGLTSHTRR